LRPRIAFYDLENAPSKGWFYDPHKEYNIIEVEEDWFMLSFAWQWMGESKVHCRALCDYPGYSKNLKDDSHLIKDLHKLFDEADVLIAHNGDRFDRRKSNTRFLGCGLSPPSPYKTIDTLKVARRQFALNSNRLDALGQFLRLGGKMPTTGWNLHKRCIHGDMTAWPTMKRYNKRDVTLLKGVYEKLLPWVPNHPDMRVYTGKASCRNCGSHDLQMRGEERTLTTIKQRYQCKSCNHWGSVPK
jgi:hypothetical protein